MTNAKRGRGLRRGFYYLCAVAALGFALSGCGGGSGTAGSAATSNESAADPPPASSKAVTLNWTPPTENTNGSALTNLAGYDIHYGTTPGDYTQTISVSNAGIATYVVDDLTPGTYYFAVAAVNSQGTESPSSPEVSATVN
jgi:F0F1-type ATP synthase membrane subunit c/vacuolar-type H+-ATPase subunit K